MLHPTIKNLFTSPRFDALKAEALGANEWFTAASIDTAVSAILAALPDTEPTIVPKNETVGVVCAGNIPLVGFWDMYSAIVSGAKVVLKPSRRDPLMRLFDGLVDVVDTLPPMLDTVVAMGSDNTMAALKAQFPNSRLVLRGSEASFALLTGEEQPETLEKLGDDLFTHGGMGCRSVVHLFLPEGYDLERLNFGDRSGELPWAWLDNVRYERARRTLLKEPFDDRKFFVLAPHTFGTPLRPGVVGYSYYTNKESLKIAWPNVKCYTALSPWEHTDKHTPFGSAQRPSFDQVFEAL